MQVVVLPEAEQEFIDDAEFYERKQTGLGYRFRNEVADMIERIAQMPEAPRLRSGGYRRINLTIFSHYVAYIIRDDKLVVAAISHSSKEPEHWIDRI